MKKLATICMLAALISTGTAQAGSVLTFDELPFQSVDGLNYGGVTFGFSVNGSPSPDAYYGAVGPGTLAHLDGEALVGDSRGILTLDFDSPISYLQFGFALNTKEKLAYGYEIELFDESLASVALFYQGTKPIVYWTEDLFTYTGSSISRVVINPNEYYARSFAIDNLTTATIPAPGAIILGSIGVGCVGWLRKRRMLQN